ncbi:hypothetical protein SMB34_16395 [Thalassospira permensis NBRC 106175]|uniref:CENP-V/GFA domain-containing protein n=1 Tax=Thalassospira permensis NBRC 106175 TaxID=1353532 RepID=A0ABR4TPF5_9PROT|nr:hypothetical protein SMB34_16395 [Thalassospira permensis NBRC 106175]
MFRISARYAPGNVFAKFEICRCCKGVIKGAMQMIGEFVFADDVTS